ncbi:DUF2612 domain-containing protein [Methylobacterium fujisawaense]|uniref:DUF2612 domain-containing protein n=1 Tax=Methylobacterium fujisawaense TaxID=107400 RepID=UPI00313D7AC6
MAYSPAPSTADTTEVTADSTLVTLDRGNTRTADDYVALITPWQSTKARFVATVRVNVQPYADNQAVTSTLPLAYDLDYAEGVQLDAVGAWIGRSRLVPVPLPNTFFTFGDPNLGFGAGYWKSPLDPAEGMSVLPDDLYRRLLYAKILANSWDGTSEGILGILRAYFTDPSTFIIVDDAAPAAQPTKYFTFGDPARGFGMGVWKGSQSMAPSSLGYGLKVGFSGRIPASIDLSILGAGLFPIKAMGAHLTTLVTTVDQAPLFGFGPETEAVAGFGSGAWGGRPSDVAALINKNTAPGTPINDPSVSMDMVESFF